MSAFRSIMVLGLLCEALVQAATAQDRLPNVILILADDLGHGALGCYGQQKIKTPNIDRIAAGGMTFTQAYSGAHVCQPSRCVLMTGMHTGHSAIRANDTRQFLADDDVTVAEILKSKGYATGGFGKWGLGYEGTSGQPCRQGFDDWFGVYMQVHAHFYYPFWVWRNDDKVMLPGNFNGQRQTYVQDEFQREALDFIRRHHDRPFFAFLPYIIPHVELAVPEESELPYRGQFDKQAVLDPRPGYIGSEDGFTTFAGMVSRLDQYVGGVLDLVEELGIEENTIVIFTSDNGAQGGGKDNGWARMNDYFKTNGNLRDYKGSFYEGGIRVPLVVKWPKSVEAKSSSTHVVAFWDVLPTLAEAAGADVPANIDGVSFLPTLTGQGEQRLAEGQYWEYPQRNGIGRGARMGNWKAVQKGSNLAVELYDLEADPSESMNVAQKHADVVEKITAFMDRQHVAPRPPAGPNVGDGLKDYVQLPQ